MTRALEPITVDRIDADAAKVVRRLLRHGHEAYLVGGCVRDLLVGRRPKDFDVATNATPDEIRQIFRNSRIIGRRFRLVHIFFGSTIIETATFRSAPTRAVVPSGDPLIWQDNEFGSAEEDARRRDFTINGLFYDVASGKVIDWVDGMDDLRAGLVRTIGEADLRMQEDPVRILRAIMFSARLGFDIAEETHAAMVRHGALVARCSVARVLEEIYKLLRGGAAELAFRRLQEHGVLGVLFPELGALFTDPDHPAPRVPALRAGRRRRSSAEAVEEESSEALATADDFDELLEDDEAASEVEAEADFEEDDDAMLEDDGALEVDEETALDGVTESGEFDGVDDGELEAIDEQALAEELLRELDLYRPEQRAAAAEQLWGQLAALDRLVKRLETPPFPPLLLAALLTPLAASALRSDRRMGATAEQVEALVRAVASRLQVSRRHRDRLKQIIVAQRRLTQSRPRPSLMQRDYFQPAFQLFELRLAASGEHEPLAGWDELLGRKRRRRRRRKKRDGSAESGAAQEPAGGGEQDDELGPTSEPSAAVVERPS